MLSFTKSKNFLTLATCLTMLLFNYNAVANTADSLIGITITKTNNNNLGVSVTEKTGLAAADIILDIKKRQRCI